MVLVGAGAVSASRRPSRLEEQSRSPTWKRLRTAADPGKAASSRCKRAAAVTTRRATDCVASVRRSLFAAKWARVVRGKCALCPPRCSGVSGDVGDVDTHVMMEQADVSYVHGL